MACLQCPLASRRYSASAWPMHGCSAGQMPLGFTWLHGLGQGRKGNPWDVQVRRPCDWLQRGEQLHDAAGGWSCVHAALHRMGGLRAGAQWRAQPRTLTRNGSSLTRGSQRQDGFVACVQACAPAKRYTSPGLKMCVHAVMSAALWSCASLCWCGGMVRHAWSRGSGPHDACAFPCTSGWRIEAVC